MSRQLVPKDGATAAERAAAAGLLPRDPHDGLALSYDWKARLSMTLLPLIVIIAVLAFLKQPALWLIVIFLAAMWVMYAVGVWLKSRATLRLDDDEHLVTRRFFGTHTVSGADVTRVTEIPNGRSPDVCLHTAHGRVPVPTSRLQGGHSTVFAWLATEAPQATYDRGAQKVADTLVDRGLL